MDSDFYLPLSNEGPHCAFTKGVYVAQFQNNFTFDHNIN